MTGTAGDPYTTLINATDQDVAGVVIDGAARYGRTPLMKALRPSAGAALETVGEKPNRALDVRGAQHGELFAYGQDQYG